MSEIAGITGGTLLGEDNTVTGIITDSRNRSAASGEVMFVAIDGRNHDGHNYIESLYRNGVRSFLVERSLSEQLPGVGFVVVEDSLLALQQLAAHHRKGFGGTVVAITGSNGKTVVKEWIAQLWEPAEGKITRSPRSYNSQLGVPLSLLMIRGDERLAVIEAGISEPGEMERLETIIRPDVGIITNIGEAHSENFKDAEQKLSEKLKLFAGSGKIIYNAAHENIGRQIGKTYPGCGAVATAQGEGPEEENRAQVLELYKILNLKHKPDSNLQHVAMRLEVQEGLLGSTLINDSYNSDITSLAIALDYQERLANGSKALILSDIPQSGLAPEALYSQVAELVDRHGIGDFTGIGPEISACKHLFKGGQFFENTGQFIQRTNIKKFAGSTILIKGSRMFGFERISAILEKRRHTTIMEVNLDAMTSNLNYYRSLIPSGCRVMAMVKACSYGSGTREVAAALQHHGVDYLAVAFADEGVVLREAGIELPIVVLNSDPGSFGLMAENSLEPEIYSFSSLKAYIEQVGRRGMTAAPIHIKLDTGMHRLGFDPGEAEELGKLLQNEESVLVKSIFSHLAASDDPAHDDFTRRQINSFDEASRRLISALPYGDTVLRHVCNSAGTERFPEAHFDMVRLGIGLYGCGGTVPGKLSVVSRLKTQIVQIKTVAPPESVGYGRKGTLAEPSVVAVLPVGYADGLNRRLSRGNGKVNVNGALCPIIGNVCMDTCMVDITQAGDVKEGDTVEIFGDSPTAEEVAGWLETIPYEVLTSVSARIKRIYTEE